jgi:hypothetical protein
MKKGKPSMQSLGGLARAAKLSPKQRSDSARKAVEARWAKARAEKKPRSNRL